MKKDSSKALFSVALGLGERGMLSLVGAGGKTSLIYVLARELANKGKKVLVTTTTHMLLPLREQAQAKILSPNPEKVLEELRSLSREMSPIFAASHQEGKEGKVAGFSQEGVERLWQEGFLDWVLVEADGAASRPLKAPASHEPVVPPSSSWVVGVVGLDAIGKPLEEAWVFRWEIYGSLVGLARGEEVTPESVATLALHPEGLFRGAPPRATKILWLNKLDLPGAHPGACRILSSIEQKGWGGIDRVIMGSVLGMGRVGSLFIHKHDLGAGHARPIS